MIYRLEQLLRKSAERFAERSALVFKGEFVTYSELNDRSDKLAAVLVEHGVARGDRIGIYAKKSIASVAQANSKLIKTCAAGIKTCTL